MKFLVDAQLPRRVVEQLRRAGHDAVHTLNLPKRNRTPDQEIVEVAEREGRVVVTKDADFVNSFVLSRRPQRLLLISTGTISNASLLALLDANISNIADAFAAAGFVELTRDAVIVHT